MTLWLLAPDEMDPRDRDQYEREMVLRGRSNRKVDRIRRKRRGFQRHQQLGLVKWNRKAPKGDDRC
jgi:hypothetical protein